MGPQHGKSLGPAQVKINEDFSGRNWAKPAEHNPGSRTTSHRLIVRNLSRLQDGGPVISYIIPAHNEEVELPATLAALMSAADEIATAHPGDAPSGATPPGDAFSLDRSRFEILVVDDDSTDRTAEIARNAGARVVPVKKRHIAAVRNAGAASSQGSVLFFIDADTRIHADAIRESLAELEAGAIGGGCHFRFDGPIRWWGRLILPLFLAKARWRRIAGGCCLFARRTAFDAVGGFDERVFAAEDIVFCQDMQKIGRFVIPQATVLTSNRKLDHISFWQTMRLVARLAVGGPRSFRSREGLDLWYRQRETPIAPTDPVSEPRVTLEP
jgi:glycosyltransferase involved in cell wall biosynthesis